MAAGCVPVFPEVGEAWSDILEERQGFYGYSYRNVEEAAREVKAIIEDRGLWEEISRRASSERRSSMLGFLGRMLLVWLICLNVFTEGSLLF